MASILSSQTDNPYQSPKLMEEIFDRGDSSDCWHDQDKLVVTRNALLPRLCARCGRPGSPGRPRKIVFRQRDFGKVLLGVLIGAPICVLLLFAWPLSVHIGYTLIPILGLLIGWIGYVYLTQDPPERIELVFSFCPFHRRLQHGSAILGFAWVILLVVLMSSKRLGIDGEISMLWTYAPGMVIIGLIGRVCFVPVGVRYDGAKYYYIKGCGKSFLQSLPGVSERRI